MRRHKQVALAVFIVVAVSAIIVAVRGGVFAGSHDHRLIRRSEELLGAWRGSGPGHVAIWMRLEQGGIGHAVTLAGDSVTRYAVAWGLEGGTLTVTLAEEVGQHALIRLSGYPRVLECMFSVLQDDTGRLGASVAISRDYDGMRDFEELRDELRRVIGDD